MTKIIDRPKCRRGDCFANFEGTCRCLTTSYFKGKECPFFKTDQEIATENYKAAERIQRHYGVDIKTFRERKNLT